MDALQREYLRERQELSTKLLQAIRSHEVCTDPVTLPGLYPSSVMHTAPILETNPFLEQEQLQQQLLQQHHQLQQQLQQQQQQFHHPQVSTPVTVMQPQPSMQYAAVLPALPQNRQYHIHVNPDGSQHVMLASSSTTMTSNHSTST